MLYQNILSVNVTFATYTMKMIIMTMADSKVKLKEPLDKIIEETKKRLIINFKKIKCLVVSKRGTTSCDLCIGDIKTKLIQNFNYLVSVITLWKV